MQMKMIMERWWNDIEGGNRSARRDISPIVTTYLTYMGLGSNLWPPQWEARYWPSLQTQHNLM